MKNKRKHLPIISLCGALIAGTPLLGASPGTNPEATETRVEARPSASQVSTQAEMNQKSSATARKTLREAGLKASTIDELAKQDFDREAVEERLVSHFRSAGHSREEARQRAEKLAREIDSQDEAGPAERGRLATANQGERSPDSTSMNERRREAASAEEQDGPSQDGMQGEFAELAPEGAEVKDSARMVLNEEELNVETRQVPAGGILLRKRVVSEDADETVKLRREEIEVVRLSPEEAQQKQAEGLQPGFDEEFSEGEIFIPIMQEQAVANKEVTTREIVRAQPKVRQEEREFEATLRSEQVEVERRGELSDEQLTMQERNRSASTSERTPGSEDLRNVIRRELSNGQLELSQQELEQIEIEVEEKTVRLSGSVPSEEAKQEIEKLVQDMPQVESVENELRTS